MTDNYHYLESGLDNIFIKGLSMSDDNGEGIIKIPFVEQLHHCIGMLTLAKGFVKGMDLRFLRTEIELNPNQLSEMCDYTVEELTSFETSEEHVPQTIYDLIERLFLDKYGTTINLDFSNSLESIKGTAIQVSSQNAIEPQPFVLQAHENGYRPVAA